jgi:hypothetical protein
MNRERRQIQQRLSGDEFPNPLPKINPLSEE